ncbi:MAG: outer membrane protein assembly factor BamA [Deltaproteobacteria bacterium]
MKSPRVIPFSAALLVFVLFLLPEFAFSEANSPEPAISKLRIRGAKIISKKEIGEKIATEFPSLKPWARRPEFSEEILADDMLRIKKIYADNGYYDTEAAYDLKFGDDEKTVEITIRIDEGAPVILAEFYIEGEADDKTRREILLLTPLKVDNPFSPLKYIETKNAISAYFLERGYPKAEVKGEALVNRREKRAKVTFKVNSGSPHTFGKVSIEGANAVSEGVIRREITFAEGDSYSIQKINETRSRIFRLDLFTSVVVDSGFNADSQTADITVKVVERKLGTIKTGVGFGTEDLFRGQVILTQRNLFGGARRFDTAGKFSFLTQRFEGTFTQPYALGGGSEVSAGLNIARDDLPSFTSETVLGRVATRKSLGKSLSAFGSFNVQSSDLKDVSEATEDFIRRNNFFLTSIGAGLEMNTADNILNPSRGAVATIGAEASLRALGSDVNYVQATAEVKTYRKLFGNIVLANRLLAGVVQPFGATGTFDIPIFKRFFAGGSASMRGFAFQKLGPLDENEDPVGGNSILLGSAETRFPIYRDLGGVAFLDIGGVYPREFEFDLGDIKYAAGLGARYNTIVGPLRADVGYALNPEPGIGRIQFFLSIGHAF